MMAVVVRISTNLVAFGFLLFLCSCAVLFLRSEISTRTCPEAVEPSLVIPDGAPVTTTSPPNSDADLNWTACPSKTELRSEEHFRLWDEKLARALRLSNQRDPKVEAESWHALTENIHVLSAFVATMTGHAIHIPSLVRDRDPKRNNTPIEHPPLVCIIRASNRTLTLQARIRRVWTWLQPSFTNALILCPLPEKTSKEDEDIQVAVAVQGAEQDSLRWLQLHRPAEGVEEKCCAMCVRPIYGTNVSLWKLVEFVTHYRLIGVRRFYFYDLDMSSSLKLLLGFLQSTGVDVTLVPYKLIASTDDVHAQGQMPALYDCIFRSMSRTEYYIHVDIDELIVPARHNNITALVQEEERKRNDVGSLVVSNRYMCAEYPLNVQYSDHKHLPLQTRLFTYHNEDMLQCGFSKHIGRSRAICDAATVLVSSIDWMSLAVEPAAELPPGEDVFAEPTTM
ncbi:hypothetical protein MTO96_023121 [Rhipicephalus appendiculatus]